MQGSNPGPSDHDPSQRHTPNPLSYPGVPEEESLNKHISYLVISADIRTTWRGEQKRTKPSFQVSLFSLGWWQFQAHIWKPSQISRWVIVLLEPTLWCVLMMRSVFTYSGQHSFLLWVQVVLFEILKIPLGSVNPFFPVLESLQIQWISNRKEKYYVH